MAGRAAASRKWSGEPEVKKVFRQEDAYDEHKDQEAKQPFIFSYRQFSCLPKFLVFWLCERCHEKFRNTKMPAHQGEGEHQVVIDMCQKCIYNNKNIRFPN